MIFRAWGILVTPFSSNIRTVSDYCQTRWRWAFTDRRIEGDDDWGREAEEGPWA